MRVSVIMCVHEDDRPGPLRDAVTSILSQTHRDLVLRILVDGPVSAAIRAYLEGLPDPRVRLLFKRSLPPAATWDRAIGELRVRIRAMNERCMVSPGNVAWTGAYLALRLLPVNLVRRPCRYLRPHDSRP